MWPKNYLSGFSTLYWDSPPTIWESMNTKVYSLDKKTKFRVSCP